MQMKREAVQTFKNASIEESDDDSISQSVAVQSTSMELKFEIEEVIYALIL